MTLTEAADICHPHRFTRRDDTLDLADELVGAQRRADSEAEAAALAAADDKQAMLDFRAATYELEGCSINLRAYTRGLLPRDLVRAEIAKARAALDAMERAQ